MKRIAVLGAGGTGQAIAADLTLAGYEINLYESVSYAEKLEPIWGRGGIVIKGAARQGFAKISTVTTEIQEALQDIQIILVAVSPFRHEEIAELCIPYLSDGHTIVIGPDNGGSLVFANKFKEKKVKSKVNIAGIAGNYYPCRRTGFAEVVVALPTKTKNIAAFPAKNTDIVIESLNGIYHFTAGTNVLETALSSPNVVGHLAASLLNTGPIEKSTGPYHPYKEGWITQSVIKCIDAVIEERSELFRALGYINFSAQSYKEQQKKLVMLSKFPELDAFKGLAGPDSMQHRYITEDAAMGNALMVSLGEMINVPTPVTRALITLASTINNTDYLTKGRTVDKLGLGGLNIDELNKYLYEGER